MTCPGSRKSRRVILFLSQKTVHITLPVESCILNFFFDGEFICHHSMGCHFDSVVTPDLVISNDVIQETDTFSLILVQQVMTSLHTELFLFLGKQVWDSLGTIFMIFSCCYRHFQCTEASIQFHTQFPGHSLSVCMDELREMLFISWYDSCAWPSRIQLVFYVSITTLLKCTTHHFTVLTSNLWSPYIFSKHQWMARGAIFFCMEESSSTLLLHTHFHSRHHFVILPVLPLCCNLSHGNNVGNVQSLLAYHQHPHMMQCANIIN